MALACVLLVGTPGPACYHMIDIEPRDLERLAAYRQTGRVRLPVGDEVVELTDNYVPPGWEPRWAFGLMLMGPGLAFTPHAQFFPAPWLALEAGVGYPQIQLGGHAAFRIRPVRFGRFRPFVGALVHYYLFPSNADTEPPVGPPTPESNQTNAAYGFRLGLDCELSNRRILLGIEADLLRPFEPDTYSILGIEGAWIPWGGITLSGQL